MRKRVREILLFLSQNLQIWKKDSTFANYLYKRRMNEIHTELSSLNKEANALMSEIMKEWETLNTK